MPAPRLLRARDFPQRSGPKGPLFPFCPAHAGEQRVSKSTSEKLWICRSSSNNGPSDGLENSKGDLVYLLSYLWPSGHAASLELRSLRRQRGAAIVEYLFLLALIAVVCIVALAFLGGKASDSYVRVAESVGNL